MLDRYADVRREEAKAFQTAEEERVAREKKEADGLFIVRETARIRELAESYGFDAGDD